MHDSYDKNFYSIDFVLRILYSKFSFHSMSYILVSLYVYNVLDVSNEEKHI